MSDPRKYEAVQSQVISDYDHVGEQMKRRDEYLTRNLRRVRIYARTLDVLLGISSIGLMAYMLRKYYQTLTVDVNGQTLWNTPDQTVLWPSYLTLVTAVLTSIFSAVVLTTYLWSTTTAERIDDWRSRILWVLLIVKVAMEITTSSGMYATGAHGPANGPQSLWYQTCTATADDAKNFAPFLNIPAFCGMQKYSAISALISFILDVFSGIVFIWWFRQWRHRKMMKRHFSSSSDSRSNTEMMDRK